MAVRSTAAPRQNALTSVFILGIAITPSSEKAVISDGYRRYFGEPQPTFIERI
jgi:hypothetical protein